MPARRPFPTSRLAIPVVAFVLFLLLTAAVHLRLLAGLDLATTTVARQAISPSLAFASEAITLPFSAECAILWALLLSLFLWRRGHGARALAPFALLLLMPVEAGLKLAVGQPPVPDTLRNRPTPRLAAIPSLSRLVTAPTTPLPDSIHPDGSFPSSHAARAAFLSTFLIALLRPRASVMAGVVRLAFFLSPVALALALVAGGYHWLSDVAGGLILGSTLAILVAPATVHRPTLLWPAQRAPNEANPAPR